MKIKKQLFKLAISSSLFALGAGAFVACSSDDGDEEGAATSIELSGQLALAGTGSSLRLAATALEDLSIYCVSFEIPPVGGTAGIGADGSFSLTLATTNAAVGCFFLQADAVVGTMVFEDSSETDLAGGTSSQDRLAFSGGSSNLGTINLDLTTGQAVVDVQSIVSNSVVDTDTAASGALDMTGTYQITSSGLDLPTGYAGVCTDPNDKDCRGPMEGESIFVKLISGVKAGTETPAHAMAIWESETLFQTCGSTLGFDYADGIEKGFDFSGSGVDEGEFTWKTGLTDGWKDVDNARARYGQMKMEKVNDFNGYSGMKQYFTQYTSNSDGSTKVQTAGYQFNANTDDSGCKDSNGEPTRVNDWSSMQCSHENLTGGLHKSTCTGTSDGSAVTCIHISGTFDSNGDPITDGWPQWPSDFDILLAGPSCDSPELEQWGPDGLSCSSGTLTQGALCSSANTATEAGKLAQLRCYLEYNHSSMDRDSQSSDCVRKVRGNWSATTAAEFIVGDDGPKRAEGQHVFDLFKFDSSTSGTLRGQERYFDGVQMGDNWTDCEILESFSISLRKYPDSDDLLAEMIQTQQNLSHKAACLAEYGEEGGTQKMMFKLEKQ